MIDRGFETDAGPDIDRSALMRLRPVTCYPALGFLRVSELEVAPCKSLVSRPQEVVAGYVDEVQPAGGDLALVLRFQSRPGGRDLVMVTIGVGRL
jgi:hypothetical protein